MTIRKTLTARIPVEDDFDARYVCVEKVIPIWPEKVTRRKLFDWARMGLLPKPFRAGMSQKSKPYWLRSTLIEAVHAKYWLANPAAVSRFAAAIKAPKKSKA
jgi:hypothetical protein